MWDNVGSQKLSSSDVLIYKITEDGTLEKIEYSNLIDIFEPKDALVIYIYGLKRLYVWKGRFIDVPVAKYIPEAKDLVLKHDPNIRILRYFVIESGNEPQSFFDDVGVTEDNLQAHIDELEKNLRFPADSGTKTEVDLDEGAGKKENQKKLEIIASQIQQLLELGNFEDAHESADDLRFRIANLSSRFETLEITDLLRHEKELYDAFLSREKAEKDSQQSKEDAAKAKITSLGESIRKEMDEGELGLAREYLMNLRSMLTQSSDGSFAGEWAEKSQALEDEIDVQSSFLAKSVELQGQIEDAIRAGQFDEIDALKADLVEAADNIKQEKTRDEITQFIDNLDEKTTTNKVTGIKNKIEEDIEVSAQIATTLERAKELQQLSGPTQHDSRNNLTEEEEEAKRLAEEEEAKRLAEEEEAKRLAEEEEAKRLAEEEEAKRLAEEEEAK